MSNPYEGFQELVAEVPTLVQPLLIALVGMIPYIEAEGAAAWGVIAGVNPFVAGIAAAAGNILCVVLVVLLGARVRTAVVGYRARRVAVAPLVDASFARVPVAVGPAGLAETDAHTETRVSTDGPERPAEAKSKGRLRLERWLLRFGVPGASLIAPLALPTMLTAAAFVASGVRKEWVILWQVIAIVIWTAAVTALTTGFLSVLT